MFTAKQSWKMIEPNKVIALIRELEVWRLGNCDGCMCCRFSLRNVDIDVDCGKGSERGVTISSPSLDYYDGVSENGSDTRMLRPIAEEVARQVEESDGRGPCPVRFDKDTKETLDLVPVRIAGQLAKEADNE